MSLKDVIAEWHHKFREVVQQRMNNQECQICSFTWDINELFGEIVIEYQESIGILDQKVK